VLTHGFVLDQSGIKMSKSIGNVIDPLSIINGGSNRKTDPAYGADILRLWVSSVDYSGDVMIGKDIMKQVFDVYRKLRNTARYMVGNIHDFDLNKQAVAYDELPSLDKYMLHRMSVLTAEVEKAYDSYSFLKVYQAMQRFAVVELSNFYLDIAKDRLYIPEPDSFRRRSCQTVLAHVLENFARALAPVVPHTAEDLWQKLPYQPVSQNPAFPDGQDGKNSSVFQAGWFPAHDEWKQVDQKLVSTWNVALDARDAVNKVLEAARVGKTLGASMEAAVKIYAPDAEDARALRELVDSTNVVDELRRALIVSSVEIVDSQDDISEAAHTNMEESNKEAPRFFVGMDKHTGTKCDRCWHYDDTVGTFDNHPLICYRCVDAVTKMGLEREPVQEAVAI